MHDTLSRLGRIPLYKRLFALVLFLGLLVGFRHLALVGVTLVVLARGLGALGGLFGRLLKRSERVGVMVCLLLLGLLLGLLGLGVFHLGTRYYAELTALRSGRPLTDLINELQRESLARMPSWIRFDELKDKIPELMTPAMTYLRATGRVLLHLLLGVILAIIYLLDRKPVDDMLRELDPESIVGALSRYFRFLSGGDHDHAASGGGDRQHGVHAADLGAARTAAPARVYAAAVSVLAGSGGWKLGVWHRAHHRSLRVQRSGRRRGVCGEHVCAAQGRSVRAQSAPGLATRQPAVVCADCVAGAVRARVWPGWAVSVVSRAVRGDERLCGSAQQLATGCAGARK